MGAQLPPGFVLDTAPQPASPRPAPIGARSIPGTGPKPPAPPTPFQVEDQEAQRAQRQRDAVKFRQDQAEWLVTHNPDGSEKPKPVTAGDPTEGEKKIATLLTRIAGGANDINNVTAGDPSAAAPGFIESMRGDLMPGGVGGVVTRGIAGGDRRTVHDSQRDVLDALLTLGTGAAYNAEQLSGQMASYFPQYGDSQSEIAVKNQRLQRLIEAAKANAGPAWAQVEPAIAPFMGGAAPATTGTDGKQVPAVKAPTNADIYANGVEFGMDRWGKDDPFNRDQYLADRYGLKSGDEDKIVGFWRANIGNPGLTPDGAKKWYVDNGLPPPSDADLAKAVEQSRTASGFQGLDTTDAEAQYKSNLDKILKGRGSDPESMSGTIGAKAAQGIMIGSMDEIGGLGGALAATLSGNNPIAGYQVERDVLRREQERAANANPKTALAAEIGGSLVTGGMGFGEAARVANLASKARTLSNTGRAAALQREAVKQVAKAGAKVGGAAGFNYGEGPVGSPLNAFLGATTGAGVGAAVQAAAPSIGKAMTAVTDKFAPPAADQGQQAVIEAGKRMAVPVRAADVLPDMARRRAVVKTTEAGNIIRRADEADVAATEGAIARNVGGGGQALDRETFGETARAALMRHGTQTREKARKLYEDADKQVQGQRFGTPTGAAQIDTEITTLREAGENTNGPMIRFLEGLKKDLGGPQGGGITITGLRDQRTAVRSNLKNAGLDATAGEATVMRVLDAVGQDIDAALRGKPAQALYRQADNIWRERAKFRKEITERLLGSRNAPKSGEAVAKAVHSMASADLGRMRRMWEVLDPDEKADLAASFAASLGRDRKGDFSFARLLSQTMGDGLSQKPAVPKQAARLIFGKDGLAALEDLQTLARAKVSAASETNYSRTGNVVQSARTGLRSLLLAGLGLSQGGVVGGIVLPAAGHFVSRMGDERAARLVTNPEFVKWLRTVPQSRGEEGINRQLARLESIAAKVPGMTADVDVFKRAMLETANDNASRIAAEPGGADDKRQVREN